MVIPCSRSAARPSVRLAKSGVFAVFGSAVKLVNLVGQQGFAVVEQAADERGFAVIDTAGGNEA